MYITEATKNSKGKRYKCPFCDYRDYKEPLVNHIDKKHSELIPKDSTAARLVFNIANKKDHGTCVCGCGKETAWREDLWRYDRYATPECVERYKKQMKARMVKKYGKEHLLNDENMQNKMLAGRSISGTYKFSSSGEKNYVGSYEKKFLEFCDKVMNYKSYDIEQPGPAIEYEFEGKKHFWITDFYIPSANLVLDIKDGGDNPNNREMDSYRKKQKLKEAAIAKTGKYNYIRLTNNDFVQLMLVLAEIKSRMIDSVENNKEYKPIIQINEFTSTVKIESTSKDEIIKEMVECMIGIAPGGRSIPDTYVVNYMKKDSFDFDQAISDSSELDRLLVTDKNGNITLKNKKLLEGTYYEVYKFNGKKYKLGTDPTSLFEMITGSELLFPDQLEYDDRFDRVLYPTETMMTECVTATIADTDKMKVPIMTSISLTETGINSYIDFNGIYIQNEVTGLRSKSYKKESSIPKEVIQYIRKGEI